MANEEHCRWPTKLKTFGIDDPFQRLVVAKYEGEIPWQRQVKDPETLDRFIAERMLPRLLERVDYPPRQDVKHHYVSARHVDLDLALATDPELDTTDKGVIELLREEDGEEVAVKALLDLLNWRKVDAFQEWVDVLETNYPEDPAFRLLLMRPLFDLSGPGTRRPVVPPDEAVIDWVHRRILDGRVLPSRNVGRVYCWRLGSGGQRMATNGWQYVPRGPAHADRLAAAARGSGWCVASRGPAVGYLRNSAFFILHANGEPVVALRVAENRVLECQGRYNGAPVGWEQEILLFIQTLGLEIAHREELILGGAETETPLDDKPLAWWRERARFWPFAASRAPQAVRERLQHEGVVDVSHYVDFPGLHRLLDGLGIRLGPDEWRQIVESDPTRFRHCPQELHEDETLREACAQGWRERIEDGDVTDEELVAAGNFLGPGDWRQIVASDPTRFRHCPKALRTDETLREICTQGWLQRIKGGEVSVEELVAAEKFVKADSRFQEALETHLLADLYKQIRRPARTWVERNRRFRMEKVLPAMVGEARPLAVNRGVGVLLSNEDGDYREDRFPAVLRAREDFPAVQREAWIEAMLAHPPLWFALPSDLAREVAFQPVVPRRLRVDLDAWVTRVAEKPWLLTQQTGVPKSIRRHPRVLQAYRDGWAAHIRVFPWRLWQQRGMYRRVYASYALLSDSIFLNAMEDGWRQRLEDIDRCWGRTSGRMRSILQFPLTALRAIQSSDRCRRSAGAYEVMVNIRDRLREHPRLAAGGPLVEEITNRLADEWIYLHKPRGRGSSSVGGGDARSRPADYL